MLVRRRIILFLYDLLLVCSSLTLAYLLRFDFRIPDQEIPFFIHWLLVGLFVKPALFIIMGFYKSLWRYASLQDAVEIFKGVVLASVLTVIAIFTISHFTPIPRSVFFLDGFILFTFMAGSRLGWRAWRETGLLRRSGNGPRTLIVGAGDAGNLLLKEIRRQKNPPYNVVGFIDDDAVKYGMRVQGVPVIGTTADLQTSIRDLQIEDVIIAIPTAAGKTIRQIIKSCEHCKIRFKILPALAELIDGRITTSHIRDINIEDLLGREQIRLDESEIRNYLGGKRVMVTGAAGSIGSEICRQLAKFMPAKLILLDSAETPLYHIEKDLLERFPELLLIPVLADIRHPERLDYVFESFKPEVIFHAAAFKHVPMMEYNPVEAITNNIAGTRNLAEKAHSYGVSNFVMVSTDKAVNPTNIMGASKRAAEIFVQSLAQNSRTTFTTVRFGNVLGSNGSVIPLFMEQIKKGGPVTITHPDVVRFFMTIPEAAQLVLQAGCIGKGGEIFLLDMGEPVKIIDLAEELIRLSGFTPHEEIEIIYSGLRPGEKLYEELLISGEGIKPTSHHKIKVLGPVNHDFAQVSAELDALMLSARDSRLDNIMTGLKELVPEFKPQYDDNDSYSHAFKRLRPDVLGIHFPPHEG